MINLISMNFHLILTQNTGFLTASSAYLEIFNVFFLKIKKPDRNDMDTSLLHIPPPTICI